MVVITLLRQVHRAQYYSTINGRIVNLDNLYIGGKLALPLFEQCTEANRNPSSLRVLQKTKVCAHAAL